MRSARPPRQLRRSRRPRLHHAARRSLARSLDALEAALRVVSDRPTGSQTIHHLRVAARRLLAQLTFMRGIVRKRPRRWLERRLRGILRATSAVRDLDILDLHMRRHAAVVTPHSCAPMRRAIADRRRAMDEVLRRVVWSLDMTRVSACRRRILERSSSSGNPSRRLERRLRRWIDRFLRSARRPHAGHRSLHRLRMRCKRLRYVIGGLRDVLPGVAERSVSDLHRFQDRSGACTDHWTAVATARMMGSIDTVATRRTAWRAVGRAERRAADRARRSLDLWWDNTAGKRHRRHCRRCLRAIQGSRP